MAHEDVLMANAPPTPEEDAPPAKHANLTSPSVDFSPSTVPYNEAFENELMNLILHPSEHTRSPNPSSDTPLIPASQLPVPLFSHLRTHPSPIPGLFVTNKNGYHTGGPGPSPQTIKAFAEEFMNEQGIEDAEQLERVVERIKGEKMAELRARMEERERAVQRNKEIDEELEKLRLQRDAELRVLEKMKGVKK